MNVAAKILVVDDDRNVRKTLCDILRLNGYETVAATTGAQAIAATEMDFFSITLIDLVLPDMLGLEVMRQIKVISPTTNAIILTGHASLDTAMAALRDGAYSYLQKPCDIKELLQTMKQAVNLQNAHLEIERLASFPRQNPSPVFEIDAAGNVSYANPAADLCFPNLRDGGLSHPLLACIAPKLTALRSRNLPAIVSVESAVDDQAFELQISFIDDTGLIRIYATNITQRKLVQMETQRLATTDTLTGSANRHEFTRVLGAEIARASRHGTTLSVIMYDIDRFKQINDTLGHDAGDAVLKAYTLIVKNTIRGSDTVARWGGDEFMIVTPQTDLDGAMALANNVRAAVAQRHLLESGEITASFGIAQFAPHDDCDSLLKRLDEAMYSAKEKGRDRIEPSIVSPIDGKLVA